MPGSRQREAGSVPRLVTAARPVLLVVPVAAVLGVGSALMFNSVFDNGSSGAPAFRAALARQNHTSLVADHSPRRAARQDRAPARKKVRKRSHARTARAAAPAATQSTGVLASAPAGTVATGTQTGTVPVVTNPAPVPVRTAPAPVVKRPVRSAPRKTGGGGTSFDDSG